MVNNKDLVLAKGFPFVLSFTPGSFPLTYFASSSCQPGGLKDK